MKQLVPTGLDEYLAEHKEGDMVTGRIIEISGGSMRVQLGEGVQASCQVPNESAGKEEEHEQLGAQLAASSSKPDLSSLGSMLQARWKTGAPYGLKQTRKPANWPGAHVSHHKARDRG